MNRREKEQTVASLKESFENAGAVVLVHYKGLTVEEMTTLRKDIRIKESSFTVAKNRLAKLAVIGTPYENLSDQFVGPTAIAFSQDPTAAAKGVVEFAKEHEKLVVLAGAIKDELMDSKQVQSLAKLPSLDELRAKIICTINTPATRIAGVLQAPGGQVARVLGAYAQAG